MPAKGKQPDSPLMRVVKLPFTVGWFIVFTPAHYFMWLLVDKIGDPGPGSSHIEGAWWISKWVMKKGENNSWVQKKVQTAIAFCKELRYVLVDYWGWERIPSPKWRCKFCAKPGTWWCVECSKKHCPQCAFNQHAPLTLVGIHSLEKMKAPKDTDGLHIFSPFIPDLMFIGLCFYLWFGVELMGPRYASDKVTCPMIDQVRSFVNSKDAITYQYYKSSFFTWCDYEDSFFRFILDTWVRGIVMQNDNTLLVLQTLPAAMLIIVGLEYVVAPVAAFFYAMLWNVVYFLENRIDKDRFKEAKKWERTLEVWSGSSWFGVGSRTDEPPPTWRRERDCLDPLEEVWYIYERNTRMYRYSIKSSRIAMQNLVWQLTRVILVLRLALIWVPGLAGFLKFVFGHIGFGSLIRIQERWYAGQWNLLVDEERARGLARFAYSIFDSFVDNLPGDVKTLGYLWFGLVICWVIISMAVATYIIEYRRAFNKEYFAKGEGGQKIPGPDGNIINAMDFGQENWWIEKAPESKDDSMVKTPTAKANFIPDNRKLYSSRGSVFFKPEVNDDDEDEEEEDAKEGNKPDNKPVTTKGNKVE